MNGKITQALSDNKSGDIQEYFNEMDKIIQLNDVFMIVKGFLKNVMIDQHQLNIINIQNSIFLMLVLIV